MTSCEFTINPLPSLETNNSFSFFESLKNRIFSSAISSKTIERASNPRPVEVYKQEYYKIVPFSTNNNRSSKLLKNKVNLAHPLL